MGVRFISKLSRKLNIRIFVFSGMHFVCTSCQKISYILAILAFNDPVPTDLS